MTSSSSSFEDLVAPGGSSTGCDILLADSLLNDIEHFATNCGVLRNLLGGPTAAQHKNGAATNAECRGGTAVIAPAATPHAGGGTVQSGAGGAGTAKCLQVHAALAHVSQSVRTLLLRYARLFKTSAVLVAISQLVQSIKMAVSAHFSAESTQLGLHALQRLEDAVALSLRGAL
ncbi:hypothetical protein GPALN_012390 [Globodera pallida]|nr:hypothetical protein GPALN_012390 [Globodera pallida]